MAAEQTPETQTELSHIDAQGRARMVDVGEKDVTERRAVAEGRVLMQPETLKLIRDSALKKGDVLTTAEIAGVMAAKRTHELIPLCHPLMLKQDPGRVEPGRRAAIRGNPRRGAVLGQDRS